MFPPENSQYNRQLMNLNGSKSRAFLPFRNASQRTLPAVQSLGTALTHCPFPCGVLRLIHASTWVILPTIPSLIHLRASCSAPKLVHCKPSPTTCFDLAAASRHCSASASDHVIVFSQ